jgi:hypothetical protein
MVLSHYNLQFRMLLRSTTYTDMTGSTTLHYITLIHYITLHYITLHYITLHYITLHYITLPPSLPLNLYCQESHPRQLQYRPWYLLCSPKQSCLCITVRRTCCYFRLVVCKLFTLCCRYCVHCTAVH